MRKFLSILLLCLLISGCSSKTFYIDDKYYGQNEIIEIDDQTFNELEMDKASFIIFIYQPFCNASHDFNNILIDFSNTYDLAIYKISYASMKETSLSDHIQYFPSVAIYQKGKIQASLDANKDEDIPYYQSVDGFKDWLTQFIILE